MKREIRDYLEDILDAVGEIEGFISGLKDFNSRPLKNYPSSVIASEAKQSHELAYKHLGDCFGATPLAMTLTLA